MENAAALAVFSSRTVTRRACCGKSTNKSVSAPLFTLRIHMDYGPMPSRTDCIPARVSCVWPPLSGSALSPLQDGEGWSFTFSVRGGSLHLQGFTASSGGPASMVLVWHPSRSVRERNRCQLSGCRILEQKRDIDMSCTSVYVFKISV